MTKFTTKTAKNPRDLSVWLHDTGTPSQDIADFLQIDHPGITVETVKGYIKAGYTEAGKAKLT